MSPEEVLLALRSKDPDYAAFLAKLTPGAVRSFFRVVAEYALKMQKQTEALVEEEGPLQQPGMAIVAKHVTDAEVFLRKRKRRRLSESVFTALRVVFSLLAGWSYTKVGQDWGFAIFTVSLSAVFILIIVEQALYNGG